jgi:hypothetical protein
MFRNPNQCILKVNGTFLGDVVCLNFILCSIRTGTFICFLISFLFVWLVGSSSKAPRTLPLKSWYPINNYWTNVEWNSRHKFFFQSKYDGQQIKLSYELNFLKNLHRNQWLQYRDKAQHSKSKHLGFYTNNQLYNYDQPINLSNVFIHLTFFLGFKFYEFVLRCTHHF